MGRWPSAQGLKASHLVIQGESPAWVAAQPRLGSGSVYSLPQMLSLEQGITDI